MALARWISYVNCRADRLRHPVRYVLKHVSGQRFGDRVRFRSPGHIQLAEEDQSGAFAVFDERAVLEAIAAVDNRQKIAARRLLDENGGDAAAIAAAPEPCDGNVAPLDRRSVTGAQCVIETRRKNRGFAAPIAPMFRGDSRENRMIGHARENPAQAVLRHAKSKTLFQ